MGWRKLLVDRDVSHQSRLRRFVVAGALVVFSALTLESPLSIPDDAVASVSTSPVFVEAGFRNGCAAMSDGTVRCWGQNSDYQLGNGSITSSNTAILVPGITDAVKVSVDPGNVGGTLSRSCALLQSGEIRCWGNNASGSGSYLGSGDTVAKYSSPIPVCVSGSVSAGSCVPLTNAIDVSLDIYGGCAVTSTSPSTSSDNRVYCWGGFPVSTVAVPVCTSGTVAQNTCTELDGAEVIKSDYYHRCVLRSDSTAFCWGSNSSGQLGIEATTPSSSTQARQVTVGGVAVSDIIDIATGGNATCIIRPPSGGFTFNRIQCVGTRYYGHLGDGWGSSVTGWDTATPGGRPTDTATWTDICGFSPSAPSGSCANTVLPGSADAIVGGSTAMCARIPSGYGGGDNGWNCWSAAGSVYTARPSSFLYNGTWTSIRGYIGQICTQSNTFQATGECETGKRFLGTNIGMSGSTICAIRSAVIYCWGMKAGGSIPLNTEAGNFVNYPFAIGLGASTWLRTQSAGAEPGAQFVTQPVVQLVSSDGSDATTAGVVVSATVTGLGGATGTLTGTPSATTDNLGRATFTDLGISASGTYGVSFAATGYGSTGQTIRVATMTSRTLTINAGSFSSSYAGNGTPPTITSTASAGSGQKTFTSSTTGVCTVGSTSGVVTFVDNGTCTIGASIASDGTYSSVSATPISFTINEVSRSVSIDSGSYQSTYVQNQSGPTLTATRSAGTGAITYSTSSPSVCSIGVNSGTITFSSTGACVVSAAVAASGYYAAATSNTVSISVTAPPSSTSTTSSSTTSTSTTAPASSRSATTTTVGVTTQSTVAGAVTTTTVFGQSAVATVAPRANVTTTTVARDNSNSDDSSSTTTSTLPPVPVATAPPEATAQQLAPIDVPTIDRGGAAVVIGGEEVPVEITRENDQVLIRAGMFDARFAGLRSDGSIIPLDSDGFIRVESGDAIRVEVMGFASNSDLEVRLYSDPMLLGEATVDADGKMLSAYEIPEGVERGAHRVVLVGKNQRYDEVTFTAGIIVGAEAGTTLTTRLLIAVPIGLAVLLGMFLPAILRRRREEEEAVA